MADTWRSAGKRIAVAAISVDQLPFKKRNQNIVSQFKIPGPPNSRAQIFNNQTPEIDLYENKSGEASVSQTAIKNAAKETLLDDIYEYLNHLELEAGRRAIPNYIERGIQKEFTIDMRSIFVDWLIKVAEKCKLRSHLVHLTISCTDRYVSVNAINRKKLQSLGVASMLISLKYEYKSHLCANDLCNATGTKCTTLEVVKMEFEILKSLEFEIGIPTIYTFLRKYARAAQEEDGIYELQLEFLCDYLAELSLLEYKCFKFMPSLVAASVVFLSRFTIESETNPWSTPMQKETGYDAPSLKECVLLIHSWQMRKKGGGILNALKNKYNQHEFRCVSDISPPDEIPEDYFDLYEDDYG